MLGKVQMPEPVSQTEQNRCRPQCLPAPEDWNQTRQQNGPETQLLAKSIDNSKSKDDRRCQNQPACHLEIGADREKELQRQQPGEDVDERSQAAPGIQPQPSKEGAWRIEVPFCQEQVLPVKTAGKAGERHQDPRQQTDHSIHRNPLVLRVRVCPERPGRRALHRRSNQIASGVSCQRCRF